MKIPNFQDVPVIEKRGNDYYWSDQWRTIMFTLFQQLQKNLGNEGLVLSEQSTDNIAIIKPKAETFTMIADSTTDQLKVKLQDGNFHVITVV